MDRNFDRDFSKYFETSRRYFSSLAKLRPQPNYGYFLRERERERERERGRERENESNYKRTTRGKLRECTIAATILKDFENVSLAFFFFVIRILDISEKKKTNLN